MGKRPISGWRPRAAAPVMAVAEPRRIRRMARGLVNSRRARAEAAKWHVRQPKYDADRKATDVEQRRIEEMWKTHEW